jgi:endoglucanase
MKKFLLLFVPLVLITACTAAPITPAAHSTATITETNTIVSASETAVTFETKTPTVEVEPIKALVIVNQVGYLPSAQKIAFTTLESENPLTWNLIDSSGSIAASGQTKIKGNDATSSDFLQVIDFTDVNSSGQDYQIEIEGIKSVPFAISEDIYTQLSKDALAYFYHNRSGIPIDAQYVGENYARPAGHLSDNTVTCWKGTDADGVTWPGCDYTLDAAGGWYDAGDLGKYVVNGGIAVWTLMYLYEQMPDAWPDGSLAIPENTNGVPDVLDEARWEMEFLLSMQVPEGQTLAGMAHHKLHSEVWHDMPGAPPTSEENDNANLIADVGRYVYAPSTAATLNLAATAAQCSRLWKDIDTEFSQTCLSAAKRAWKAALANPQIYAGNNPGNGGGNYDDTQVSDEFYWAAAELFITTGEDDYLTYLLNSEELGNVYSFDWASVAPLGTLSLVSTDNALPLEKQRLVRNNIVVYADELLEKQTSDGYSVLINSTYPWGSNGLILNNMMIVTEAYTITGEPQYLDAVRESMSYILGRNPVNQSYVTGFGANAAQHVHHRFWSNIPEQGYPPPPAGALAGGANANPVDETAINMNLIQLPENKRYTDTFGSYSTNEVAINWNAPLAWMSVFLDKNR